jgi:hypothetical protein
VFATFAVSVFPDIVPDASYKYIPPPEEAVFPLNVFPVIVGELSR